jgi:hypothetical protein
MNLQSNFVVVRERSYSTSNIICNYTWKRHTNKMVETDIQYSDST